jgi:adenylate kinase
MNMVFLGPPGAGKGTQASRVAEKYSIPHISTGAMLRDAMAEGTEMGKQAKSFVDSGKLVPDEVVIGIVCERLAKADCKKGFLLDGFPRTVPQAEALEGFAALDLALNVDADEDIIVARIAGRRMCLACGEALHVNTLGGATACPKCGGELYQRTDDNESTVRNRMKVYNDQTKPLIDFYSRKGILKDVDGDRDINVVFADIVAILEGAQ